MVQVFWIASYLQECSQHCRNGKLIIHHLSNHHDQSNNIMMMRLMMIQSSISRQMLIKCCAKVIANSYSIAAPTKKQQIYTDCSILCGNNIISNWFNLICFFCVSLYFTSLAVSSHGKLISCDSMKNSWNDRTFYDSAQCMLHVTFVACSLDASRHCRLQSDPVTWF